MQISNNKILITGGASGIGLGFTELFIKENNTVIICGRRQEALDKAASRFPGVITRQCDLEIEKERTALFEWVSEKHPDLNVLIHNAGIQNWMKVIGEDFFEKAKQEVGINILAPLHLTGLFLGLPSLTTIINITSGLAFVPLTRVPVYSATKAFFRSFTLSLRHQLQDAGIEVIEVIPPKLNTDLGGKGLHDDAPPVREFLESIFTQLKNGDTELGYALSAQQVKVNNTAIQEHFMTLNTGG
ncbi:SDR family oxidoreductase [Sinomicrobium sp. M5D2P17]